MGKTAVSKPKFSLLNRLRLPLEDSEQIDKSMYLNKKIYNIPDYFNYL